VRQLKGFERIELQPGETKTLKFILGKNELQFWGAEQKRWIVEPSEFDVWAGEDSTASLHAELPSCRNRAICGRESCVSFEMCYKR
jgi:beta-glucosidase